MAHEDVVACDRDVVQHANEADMTARARRADGLVDGLLGADLFTRPIISPRLAMAPYVRAALSVRRVAHRSAERELVGRALVAPRRLDIGSVRSCALRSRGVPALGLVVDPACSVRQPAARTWSATTPKGSVMPFGSSMSKNTMSAAISALDQALYMHEQWCNAVYCSLICRLPADERDLADLPHRRCPFGQWYYAQQDTDLGQHPGFVAVASQHEQLHRVGANLLTLSHADESISVRDYDGFVNATTRLRAEVVGLRHELEDSVTNRDPLTGAASRIGMLTKLRIQQQLVKRELQSCTIAMMDLDLFKAVNDGYGHQAGDTVLIEAVRYVLTHMRPYDEFFRYGGEEFLVCIPGMNAETGYDAVERVREGLAEIAIDVGGGRTVRVTASFGVTLLDADVPIEESITRADQALYRAKAAGRNQATLWDPSMA
jgi:diguanylate cyclase